MRRKTVLSFIVIGLVLIGIVPGVLAAKPETPSVFDAIADLKANVSALWTNATVQKTAIDNEEVARDAEDQALWTNATEQQSAIDAIEPGSTVHLGAYDRGTVEQHYTFSTDYQAVTDGFVCAYMFNPTADAVRMDAWTMSGTFFELRAVTFVHPGEAESLMIPVKAGDYWMVLVYGTGTNVGWENWKIFWIPLVTGT